MITYDAFRAWLADHGIEAHDCLWVELVPGHDRAIYLRAEVVPPSDGPPPGRLVTRDRSRRSGDLLTEVKVRRLTYLPGEEPDSGDAR